jgi:hypothetical protein
MFHAHVSETGDESVDRCDVGPLLPGGLARDSGDGRLDPRTHGASSGSSGAPVDGVRRCKEVSGPRSVASSTQRAALVQPAVDRRAGCQEKRSNDELLAVSPTNGAHRFTPSGGRPELPLSDVERCDDTHPGHRRTAGDQLPGARGACRVGAGRAGLDKGRRSSAARSPRGSRSSAPTQAGETAPAGVRGMAAAVIRDLGRRTVALDGLSGRGARLLRELFYG